MNHIALYRAWRSQKFEDMVGQTHITRTLQNALLEGRLSHAYLFSGPRGTGKTSAAKILAKAINCERGPAIEPCNECEACRRITAGTVMDVVEIDAASNRGVDEIRDIRDKVKYAPTEVRKKVYIIDEVHMLTTEAFNALLKTLEEPPEHVLFVLATTEPHRIPATIISRCQRFDFRRIPLEEQTAWLRHICDGESVAAEPEALQLIARLSDGGMRDAINLLDQTISFSGEQVTYGSVVSITGGMASEQFALLAKAVQDKDIGAALEMVDKLVQEGKSADKCLENLMYFFRDLLMLKTIPDSEVVTERILDRSSFVPIAQSFSTEQIFQIIELLNHFQGEMKFASQPQTLFEVAMMRLCSLEPAPAGGVAQEQSAVIARLTKKLEQLEQQVETLLKNGVVAQPPSALAGGSADARGTQPSARSASVPSVGLKKSSPMMERFVREKDSPRFTALYSKWSSILNQVKDRKITVHAWLLDGEPVSIADDQVLVAFKNTIHRSTTEKAANKQIIEQVISEALGESVKLTTVMSKEWKDALDSGAGAEQPAKEEFELVSEEEASGKYKEDWINEAIQLFGENLVTIKEEDK